MNGTLQVARLLINSSANVIRSLREDVQVSQNIYQRVRMVAQLRRERMVAHDFANSSLLGPV